jgi:predicted glycogen debranching enzyme
MSYLKFEHALMSNLQESLQKEILGTNRSGAYYCSTIVDCNTRKYHGLLVVPVPELDDDNHVLLSSLDVSVIQHGARFNLGVHKYQGNHFSPNGHKYIREYNCDKVPATIYRVGGVILKKETVFQHYENRILIRYTLVDAHSDTILQFRPFLAFRSVKQFTHENSVASRDYSEVEKESKLACIQVILICICSSPKAIRSISNRTGIGDWNIRRSRSGAMLLTRTCMYPGYFEMGIKKGESIVFAASTSESQPENLEALCEQEIEKRVPRNNFFHCLVDAAHQFHIHADNGDRYILAGYPWFKCRARDTFIALPGLTLSIEEYDYFELIMKTAGTCFGGVYEASADNEENL